MRCIECGSFKVIQSPSIMDKEVIRCICDDCQTTWYEVPQRNIFKPDKGAETTTLNG